MNGAELLVKALEREGTEVVFGYPGGAIMPVYDALVGAKLRHVLVRHEQGAALAADGYARATGRVGVCMATSGPGATNLVTGIANAFLDSVPVVAITGQVATSVLGTDAFQEVDTVGITMPIVKHSFLVRRVEQLASVVREAFAIASSGRPGPVLIDLPKDVGLAETSAWPNPPTAPTAVPAPDAGTLAEARALLRDAKRPLVYAGGGIGMARALAQFRAFVERTRVPVVSTLKGLGCVPTDHPLFLGMLGMHGTKAANLAVQQCDVLVGVGVRFDDRATGKLEAFASGARVIHFDVDPAEVGKLRPVDVPVVGEMGAGLDALDVRPDADAWRETCATNKVEYRFRYDAPGEGVYAPALLKRLTEQAGDQMILTCDVGQHQMWVAQHCRFARPEQHLTSGGLGAMGYGLPAAVGAQFGRPNADVVCVSGDGSIMMNIQELATIRRYDLPIKIVLIDNSTLGMVRQWQELFFEERYSEVDLSDNPDFVEVAKSFGIPAFRVDRARDVDSAVKRLLSHRGPCLAHVPIDPRANVWPLVPPGQPNHKMLDEENRQCVAP